jgi:DNA polymerase III delta prime subunit
MPVDQVHSHDDDTTVSISASSPTPASAHSVNSAMPWVEKYRPSCFEHIVLEPMNRIILSNILKTNYFPNLLLYGPPGTGKTTTIMNLVTAYQSKLNMQNRGLMIHLNASDERGIDIIRNQINNFVSTKSMFGNGIKFVILDEVDYMTTNAQIALRYLLTSYTDNNVRFCLICNYVSRIDESLQTEFVRMRFNQLPQADIFAFLCKIRDNEQLQLSDENLVAIQQQFHSDIRSMINYIQTNQDDLQNLHVITHNVWDHLVELFQKPASASGSGSGSGSGSAAGSVTSADDDHEISHILSYFREISTKYYMDPRTIIKQFLYYIVRHRTSEFVTTDILHSIEHIIHLHHIRTDYIVHYFILKFRYYFKCEKKNDRGGVANDNGDDNSSIGEPPKKRVIKVKKSISNCNSKK